MISTQKQLRSKQVADQGQAGVVGAEGDVGVTEASPASRLDAFCAWATLFCCFFTSFHENRPPPFHFELLATKQSLRKTVCINCTRMFAWCLLPTVEMWWRMFYNCVTFVILIVIKRKSSPKKSCCFLFTKPWPKFGWKKISSTKNSRRFETI